VRETRAHLEFDTSVVSVRLVAYDVGTFEVLRAAAARSREIDVNVSLREAQENDLETFFGYESDPAAHELAAVVPRDREAFWTHWHANVLGDPGTEKKTILADGEIAGYLVCFDRDGKREVGYWIARSHWGRGIASRALAEFLRVSPRRPLHAIVAQHNPASRRVLEKCGFRVVGVGCGSPDGRGKGVDEWHLELRGPGTPADPPASRPAPGASRG